MDQHTISSLRSATIDLPPSCIEFSPLHPLYFLVGTYSLEKHNSDGKKADEGLAEIPKRQNRSGSIVIFCLIHGELERVHTESQSSAILDLHFQPLKKHILGVVSSTATLVVFKFDAMGAGDPFLKHMGTVRAPGITENVLFTSFCWHPSIVNVCAVTVSTGKILLLRLQEDYQTCSSLLEPVMSHSLEAWCVAFSHNTECTGEDTDTTVYSGGDDMNLRYRSFAFVDTGSVTAPYGPLKINDHGAGVTAILPLPTLCREKEGSCIVVSGSYDDHIRVFSIVSLHATHGARVPKLLAEANLGGGVWRLRLINIEKGGKRRQEDQNGQWRAKILVSCMHAGVRIVELVKAPDEQYSINVLARFEEHQSMNYGSDFQPKASPTILTCVSTSFYDKLLCLWEFKFS